MSVEPQYLRDLAPRARRVRPTPAVARVLIDAVATLDGPAPSAEVQRSYREQHPQPNKRKRAEALRSVVACKRLFPKEYDAWKGAQHKCSSPKNASWRYYGAIGITFHEDWKGPSGFARFMGDVGERPGDDYALCRIRKNGNYEPGNVEWRLKSNVKVGTRIDRSVYDEAQPGRVVYVHGTRADCASVVQVFECGGILTIRALKQSDERTGDIALINRKPTVGDLRVNAAQADQLALALIRLSYMAHEVQRRHDSKGARR